MSGALAFLRAFASTPGAIGSVWPSSRALARTQVDAAGLRPGHRVVELGAGTGPMTAAMRDRHPALAPLVLEPDPRLAAACRAQVPGADVVEAYAQDLPALIEARGWDAVDRVVSSLPFAGWSPELQTAVFDALDAVLAPDARMVTFTYLHSPLLAAGRRARALLEDRFASVHTTPVVWTNLPPAFVYVCDTPRAVARCPSTPAS